jgi:hypothetical protein
MTDFLTEEIQRGLDLARSAAQRKSSRLSVHDGDEVYRVLRLWDGGFALAAKDAPHLRGFVDLYDGSRHLYQCLVVASQEENGVQVYDFKWHTAVSDRPALDFERGAEGPVALIGRSV